MRRGSFNPLPVGEPLIVVEETGVTDEEDNNSGTSRSSTPCSPAHNPGLLSPYRDMRKSSLPTPCCTSGITASQVRRLSEHGTEAAPSPRETAFLATLSSGPAPAPGGRRHSVVTISRAPPPSVLFGRGRRESIAAFSSAAQSRVLPGPSRRDSCTSVPRPPSTSNSGSQFNLQLDIMDDIAEIKAARKVKLKMWQTPSQEQVCEVESMDSAGPSTGPVRYHATPESRRYSDFVSSTPTIQVPAPPKRRSSEQVPSTSSKASASTLHPLSGIVCSNNDLISILSSLASSAQEISERGLEEKEKEKEKEKDKEKLQPKKEEKKSTVDQKRSRLKGSRSNSFDISILQEMAIGKGPKEKGEKEKTAPSSWFVRRHQPKKTETEVKQKTKEGAQAACVEVKVEDVKETGGEGRPKEKDHKVVWDGRSGSVVDAQMLGSAIEVFLARRGSGNDLSPTKQVAPPGIGSKTTPSKSATGSWFSGAATSGKEDDSAASDSCDTTSLCSTLKDLFVK